MKNIYGTGYIEEKRAKTSNNINNRIINLFSSEKKTTIRVLEGHVGCAKGRYESIINNIKFVHQSYLVAEERTFLNCR